MIIPQETEGKRPRQWAVGKAAQGGADPGPRGETQFTQGLPRQRTSGDLQSPGTERYSLRHILPGGPLAFPEPLV